MSPSRYSKSQNPGPKLDGNVTRSMSIEYYRYSGKDNIFDHLMTLSNVMYIIFAFEKIELFKSILHDEIYELLP